MRYANRRELLGRAGLLTGFALMPGRSMAKGLPDWSKVQPMLESWVKPKRTANGIAVVARGTGKAEFITTGTLAIGDTTLATPDTLFRCYSMTKPVTGMAAMMLIGDGKLSLDQNVADILPAFANPRVMIDPEKSLASRPAKKPITIRNLLTHTAGLGYTIITRGPLREAYLREGLGAGQIARYALPGFPKATHAPSLAAFADRLAALPLISDPGAQWSYSVSLDLMGRVIEVISGLPFDTFLKKRIFDPLGMKDTGFQMPAGSAARMTTNYFDLEGIPVPVDPGANSVFADPPPFPFGGAGLVTTPRDYDRFLAMLMGEGRLGKTRIMSPEMVRLGTSNLAPEGARMESFVKGFGFGAGGRVTIKAGATGEGIGAYGWSGAACTVGWVDRARNIRASGWTQLMTRGRQPFVEDFAKAVYGSL